MPSKKKMKTHVESPKLPANEAAEKKPVTFQGKDAESLKGYVDYRVTEMKTFRRRPLPGILRNIEDIWRDADREYTPHELQFEKTKVRFESDEETGLRSRLVKVGTEEDWQANSCSPDLYVKINTALSILVEMNPEATFEPAARKFQYNTDLAYANWKNSWESGHARRQVKNFIFNLAKYGTGIGRTYPFKIETEKQIRVEYYKGEPNKDKYEKKNLVKYNGLMRKSLNPWNVWFCETARPSDPLSMDDWYWEEHFSWENFVENFKDVCDIDELGIKPGMYNQERTRDMESKQESPTTSVTVGFYENQRKDVFVMWIPSNKIILYVSPLPNDEGKLSLWLGQWSLRDDRSVYGIGIYEIIRQNAVMKDRLENMTMDQLTLSIYKMFFYKGTDAIGDQGQMVIAPGKGEQVSDPNGVKFLEVPGPGQDSWRGLDYVQNRLDVHSGVTQQLAGVFGGKTLGQDVQSKEAALERMKVPLDYILSALEDEAYLTLSWQKQILSTPEIMEYEDWDTLQKSLKEMGMTDAQIEQYHQEATTPTEANQLIFTDDSVGGEGARTVAAVYPEVPYHLAKDENGDLWQSEKTEFYRFGVDLPTHRLHWEGIIRIKGKSVLVPSRELERRMKLDLFNLLNPAIQGMLNMPIHVPGLLPSLKQIVRVYNENIDDWMDVNYFENLYQKSQQPQPPPPKDPKISVSVKFETLPPAAQEEILAKYMDIQLEPALFIQASAIGEPPSVHLRVKNKGAPPFASAPPLASGGAPGMPPAPPSSRVAGGTGGPRGPVASPAAGAPAIKPLAQIGHASENLNRAQEGATRLTARK